LFAFCSGLIYNVKAKWGKLNFPHPEDVNAGKKTDKNGRIHTEEGLGVAG